MKIPLNRFIAFVKPWLNILAGAIAAWIVAKLNVLGLPGLDQADTATWIGGALVWAITTGAAQLGDLKWLKGHHIDIAAEAQKQAAMLASPQQPNGVVPSAPEPPPADELGDELEPGEDELPDDDEEFAHPPTGEPSVIQPSQAGLVDLSAPAS